MTIIPIFCFIVYKESFIFIPEKIIPMKKNILFIVAISGLVLVLASCGTMRQSTAFSERKYYNFPHHNPVVVFDNKKNTTHNDIAVVDTKQQKQVVLNETGLQVLNAPEPVTVSRKAKKS